MPVDSGTIAAQVGAAGGLWTHTPVDWAGNEPPGPTAKPASWPNNAAQGYFGPGEGTRPGGAVTQSGPAGAPKILSVQPTNITTTGFGAAVVFDNTVTSSRLNYGVTQAVTSNTAGTMRGVADDQRRWSDNANGVLVQRPGDQRLRYVGKQSVQRDHVLGGMHARITRSARGTRRRG